MYGSESAQQSLSFAYRRIVQARGLRGIRGAGAAPGAAPAWAHAGCSWLASQ